MKDFLELREQLSVNFGTSWTPSASFEQADNSRPTTKTPKSGLTKPEDILHAEADAILDIAEDELKEGLKKSAARNFHAATVFYKVLGMI